MSVCVCVCVCGIITRRWSNLINRRRIVGLKFALSISIVLISISSKRYSHRKVFGSRNQSLYGRWLVAKDAGIQAISLCTSSNRARRDCPLFLK